jgi:hypothetical protein
MANPFNLMFECENCKKRFPVSSEQAPNSLTHKKEYKINGQSIFLTYYDCPDCGRRHFVQIDDQTSLNKLREVKKMFITFSVARQKDKEIPKKQQAKFKKTRQDLSDYRMKLMKEFTDKSIYDEETESDIVLRFSIC